MKQIFAKLISNSGLILIAMLAVGIWTSNIQDVFSTENAPKTDEIMPDSIREPLRKLREETELGRRVKAKYPGKYDDLADDDLGRRVKAKYLDDFDRLLAKPAQDFGAFIAERRKQPPLSIDEAMKRPVVASRGPRLSVVESYELEQQQKQLSPEEQAAKQRLKIWARIQEAKTPEDRWRIWEQEQARRKYDDTYALLGGAAARCRDGSFTYSRNRRGACSHHGGVAQWYK